MKLKLPIYILLLIPIAFGCQPSTFEVEDDSGLFIKLFGDANDEYGFGVSQDADGGFYLVGTSSSGTGADTDIFLSRTDENGNRVWDAPITQDLDQGGNAILTLDSDESLVLGYTNNDTVTTTTTEDFYLARINSSGAVLEEFTYGTDTLNERGEFLIPSAFGGYLLIGSTENADATEFDNFLVRINESGDTLYTRTYGLREKLDEIVAIEETDEGNLVWCGTVQKENGNNIRVVSTDSLGSIIYDFTYEDEIGIELQSRGLDMTAAPGGYIITGKVFSSSDESDADVLLMKIDVNGTFTWVSDLSGADTDATAKYGASVVPTEDAGYAIVGTIQTSSDNSDIYLLKTGILGNYEWSRTFGGDQEDAGSEVQQTPDDGGYIILGSIEIENNSVIGFIKTDEDGVTLGRTVEE